MTFAEKKIDYGLIPVIDVARDLFGPESRERTTANERHFPDRGGLFVNLKKNVGTATAKALAAMPSPSSASLTTAIIKRPSIGCGRTDTSRFSVNGRRPRKS